MNSADAKSHAADLREEEDEMISPCGMDCGECPIFKAANDSDFAEALAEGWRKTTHPNAEAGWFKCQGCHGDDALVWGEDCAMRNCCLKERKLANCSFCPDFPCKLITDFEADGVGNHKAAVQRLRQMKEERNS